MPLGNVASALIAMVCIIFIAHTMHDCRVYLKMGLPRAYGRTRARRIESTLRFSHHV